MKVLIACEFSGTVRDAFLKEGHDAISCDIIPTESPGPHYQGNVFEIINEGWDLMIAHPPCTDLSVSGAAWFEEKRKDGRQQEAINFFMGFTKTDIKKTCIENPVCIMSSVWRKPDQYVQPWQFGHPESKKTCLWLKNLQPLKETNNVKGIFDKLPKNQQQRLHYLPPGPERAKLRSKTFPGIAAAMAEQWGTS